MTETATDEPGEGIDSDRSREYAVMFTVEEDDQPRTEIVTVEDDEGIDATARQRAVVKAAEQSPLTHVETLRIERQGNTAFEIHDPIPSEWKRIRVNDEYPHNPSADWDCLEAIYTDERSEVDVQIYDEAEEWCVRPVVRHRQQMMAIGCEDREEAAVIAAGLMWTVTEAR